jgi:hypothetical protein
MCFAVPGGWTVDTAEKTSRSTACRLENLLPLSRLASVQAEVDLSQFERDGYVVVPAALSPDEVAHLRAYFTKVFAEPPTHPGDVAQVRQDIFARLPETRVFMTKPSILSALRAVLGDDFVFVPEMQVHDSRYGFWHKDTSSMEREGYFFHREPDFRMVQCAVYLQDNDEYGGGLDIEPGSHLAPDTTPAPPITPLWKRALIKAGFKSFLPRAKKHESAYSIPSKAGDLVIFDMRANHMATPPTVCKVDEIPAAKRKFGIFFICSRNNDHPRRYVEYVAPQPHYDYLEGGDHTYPADVLELAEEHRLTLL